MRFLATFPLALLATSSIANPPARAPVAVPPNGEIRLTPPADLDRMNAYREAPGCISIPRQVAGEDRSRDATRLDREPPGRIILAVDRQIGGCHEVALLSEERRR
jgi:hypothetical protein